MSPRETEYPTEIDQLLPSSHGEERPKPSLKEIRSKLRVAMIVAAFLVLFSIVYVVSTPTRHKFHKTEERSYKARKQLALLNDLTHSALENILKDSSPKVTNENTKLIESTQPPPLNTFQCSSQIMIMRHCDKDIQIKDKHGRLKTRDKRDIFGDGHCSSKGKERSAYIATLFVDNNEFQGLVNGTSGESVDNLSEVGDPPIPAVNATESSESSEVAIKPQFPTPIKLYALNDARYNKNPGKEHRNFREVETVIPLADKFHLAVNESFGVNEEGELALDFFSGLSESVKLGVDRILHGVKEDDGEEDNNTLRLCQNGMTVVNWKHSLIPNLARALGCGKNEGCPSKYHGQDFDTVWVITYKYSVPLLDPSQPSVDLEALSESGKKTTKGKHHRQLKSSSSSKDEISWEISAQTVKEGFDQVY